MKVVILDGGVLPENVEFLPLDLPIWAAVGYFSKLHTQAGEGY